MRKATIIIAFILGIVNMANAEQDTIDRWHMNVKAGLNVGAVTPTTMPVEIRELKGFNPHLNGTLEAGATYNINKTWSASAGVRLERMAMTTKARTKSYSTEITSEDSHMAGVWTGDVETTFDATALTVPVNVGLRLGERTKVSVGANVSYLLKKDFFGNVSNGYLRKDNPTGEKVVFDGESSASYDFGETLRSCLIGISAGIKVNVFKSVLLSASLSYGLTSVFEDGFKTITFDMHPLFANIAIGYQIW